MRLSLETIQLLGFFWQEETALSKIRLNGPTIALLLTTLIALTIAAIVGRVLKRQPDSMIDPAIVRTFHKRVVAWLTMSAVLAVALVFQLRWLTVTTFGVVSFWALREFITMTPTRRADHRALFWTFFIFSPLQFVLVGMGSKYYMLYSIMIPVYASLFLPARIAFTGDPKRFLERTAKIQFGLLICVYAFSYAPAMLDLNLYEYIGGEDNPYQPWEGSNAGLLFYFFVIVQLSDMLQLTFDRYIGKHLIAPKINGTKTWEGFMGGVIVTAILGCLIQLTMDVTPFTLVEAGCMALVIAVMGFAGSITMSAIKRDRGVKDYGTLVQGHAGVLDRIDSVCFAAPVFFHVTRYLLETVPSQI